MPYKSEKIIIEHTKHDRRIKLTEEQRQEIRENKAGLSQRKLAKLYGVSRRLISFIVNPDSYERNKELRKDKDYYDKEKHREYVKSHRRYKQDLFVKGDIKE